MKAALAIVKNVLSSSKLVSINCNENTISLRRVFPYRIMSTSSSNGESSDAVRRINRLGNEKSPYLLQHSSNPVDWYPWGNEAITKAKQEGKPIFLSIGYSTCHWCHVMEKESFASKEVADILNENFVSIKVDREERPDIDKIYMTYVQATTGSGGWPLSLWLTPNLKPIYGGTYFPPHDRAGRPGFITVLRAINHKWNEQKQQIEESGEAIMKVIEREIKLHTMVADEVPNLDCLEKCFQTFERHYDPVYGGFSKAPKFPQAVTFNFLFRLYNQRLNLSPNANVLTKEMCLHTLKLMARGGIHDHIAKGFHRYSTDEEWHVPHFEKMLYDQAQLAVVYTTAFQISNNRMYADVAHGILHYVMRDLSDESGGFYSAEDADSLPTEDSKKKEEGAFCMWTKKEVVKILNYPLRGNSKYKLYEMFCVFFDIKEAGNVKPYQDPNEEFKNKNILIIRQDKEKVASQFGISLDELKESLVFGCTMLFDARQKRPKPHLDTKIITSWNGLMISGFAKAGLILNEPKYTERALKAAQFIKSNLYMADKGILLRTYYPTKSAATKAATDKQIEGFVDDYAFLIQGLLDLYEACGDYQWLEWANELQNKQHKLFWDPQAKGYFLTTGEDPNIILRMKDDQDSSEPSSNSVAVLNLVRLSIFLNESRYWDQAAAILISFNERIQKVPNALPYMLCGLIMYTQPVKRNFFRYIFRWFL